MRGCRIIIFSLVVIGCYAQQDVSEDNIEALGHYPLDSCRLTDLKEPCCLKHGGGGDERRPFEESYASYEDGLRPFLDQALMFAKPTSYSAKDMCDAVVNSNLLKPKTALFPKKTRYNNRHKKYSKDNGDSRRLQEVIAQSSSHSKNKVSFVDGEAYSPRGAQVGIVCRAGCCNVYPALAEGDAISETCENELLGGSTVDIPDFYDLFLYLLITAGNFNIYAGTGNGQATKFSADGSLIIGRDLGGAFLPSNEVGTAPADSGPFAGISLLVGGDVVAKADADELLVLDGPGGAGETQIGGSNNGDKVRTASAVINSLKYPAEVIRKIIELQVNAISSEFYSMKENVADISITADGEMETINCVGGGRDPNQPCVAFVEAKNFEDPCIPGNLKRFDVIGASLDLVILNIYGGKQRKSQNFFVLPNLIVNGAEAKFTLVLNFVDAENLQFGRRDTNQVDQLTFAYVVVPRAHSITLFAEIRGSLLHGNPDGVVNQHTDWNAAETPIPQKPANPAVVAYCECGCPDNEKIEMAKIDRKPPHSPGYKPPHSPGYKPPHSPGYKPPHSPGYSPGYKPPHSPHTHYGR